MRIISSKGGLKMIKDYILPGAIIGILGAIIKLTINFLGYLLNFTSVVFWQLVAARFLEKPYLYKPAAYIIGGIADITFSAILGVFFVYFIYLFGTKYLLIKGIGFGLSVWVVIFGTLLGQSVQGKLPQTPSGILVTAVAHIGFGLALALLTKGLKLEEQPMKKIRHKPFRLMPSPALKIEHDTEEKKFKKPVKIEKIKHW
jgi:hypothetical protein